MNGLTNIQMLKRMTDSRVPEGVLDGVREALLHIGHSVNSAASNEDEILLERLMDTVGFLRQKGVRFTEIETCLRGMGFDWSSEIIQDVYCRFQESRLTACERFVAGAFIPEWNATAERTAVIERGLRECLKNGGQGLVLHYQPQVNMLTGDVVGAEALVRWEFNGTLVHPAEFIPVAEGSGLIVPVGEWVLQEACREAKRWHSMGMGGERGIKVGVNLSVKQFSDSLPKLIHGILCDVGLPTNLLGLEITESFLVGNDSLGMLHSLRDSGVHFSIDDFGIGYSCLAQLKDLPLDTIKIDRAFVQDLGKGHKTAVVETIIDLAKKLGVATLAEGVDSLAQAEALIEMGCSVCQGFLYSRAVTGEQFVEFAGGAA